MPGTAQQQVPRFRENQNAAPNESEIRVGWIRATSPRIPPTRTMIMTTAAYELASKRLRVLVLAAMAPCAICALQEFRAPAVQGCLQNFGADSISVPVH